jgi:3-oxoacyl-[acyl-carrier protein] reductase
MDLGLTGRRALVLGSSAGLGRAIARGLAAEGACVAVHGRDAARLAEAAAEVGGIAVPGDLADAGGVVAAAVEALGGLDVLVINTGGGRPGPLLGGDDLDDEAGWRSMLRPALAAARAGAPHLATDGCGSMVLLTARSVLEASPELARSSIFRSGVAAAGRSLALELAPAVRVNVVVPGQFPTGGFERFEAWRANHERLSPERVREAHVSAIPLGRLGRPEDLADVVTFLCSDRAAYVTGSVVRVDGGAVRGF